MRKKTNHGNQKSLGFTLVELIVVMAILGLLATVGLASFRSSQIKGRDAQRKHNLGQLQRGLEAYYNDKGQYPETDELPGPGVEWRDPDVPENQGTLYMKEIPADPSNYPYPYESDGAYYKIFAHLENQKDKDLVPEDCSVVRSEPCDGVTCNYGVSSANVRVCEVIP